MADQHRKDYVDDYRPQGGRGWPERTRDEMRTGFEDDEARMRRPQDDRDNRPQYGGDRGWRDQGDGRYERGRSAGEAWRSGGEAWRGGSDREPHGAGNHNYGPAVGQDGRSQYGPYPGSQYGGPSAYGRSNPEHDFAPHRVGSSGRESERPYGSGGDWRTSGSSGRDQGHSSGGAWGSAGSYGRSQGAGSFGGSRSWPDGYGGGGHDNGAGPDWDTSGGYEGGTSFVEPRSYAGSAAGAHPWRENVWRENYSGRGPKGYQRSDDRIREDVSDRLEQDHGVDASDISVQVLNGEVTLTGTVTTRMQKRRAEDCVERVSGVKDVTNSLRVNRQDQPQAPPSETSSSILGLGGQESRETSGDAPGNGNASPTRDAANKADKTPPVTPDPSSGLSA